MTLVPNHVSVNLLKILDQISLQLKCQVYNVLCESTKCHKVIFSVCTVYALPELVVRVKTTGIFSIKERTGYEHNE